MKSPIMEADQASTTQNSGSKRKRLPGDDTPLRGGAENDVPLSEYDDATPNKRLRTSPHESDVSASEDNDTHSKQPHSVRRKKGSRNLSNLNLRHAAQAQTPSEGTIRGSRFQEGSLTDRPSDQPPSLFTRFSRTDIDTVEHVDTLMSDYHDEVLTPPYADRSSVTEYSGGVGVESSVPKKEEARGFFHFGRQLVASFHPVALWKSVWNETKEELTREKMAEDARKIKLKANAEAKYAEMKKVGHYSLPITSSMTVRYQTLSEELVTPRDSAVAFDSLVSPSDQSRNTSAATVIRSYPASAEQSASEVPESNAKPSRGFRDRLHLHKPSFTNLHSGLKRMRSDLSLAGPREPSSSVSPVKTDHPGSTLKKVASRADLKKQQRLSKKVSDLENKLQIARDELHEALVEASPMPKLAGKYERFTPSGTLKRPKFLPGRLPTLPSERILLAEEHVEVNDLQVFQKPVELHSKNDSDLSLKEYLAKEQPLSEDNNETIKASRARAYPPRAASLFDFDFPGSNIENETPPEHKQDQVKDPHYQDQNSSEAEATMDPNSITDTTATATNPPPPPPKDHAVLDAKLKALDANYKTARKIAQPRKRRKTAEKDEIFKPIATNEWDDDDDAEWDQATPKKKRKSTGSSTPKKPSPTNGKTIKKTAAAKTLDAPTAAVNTAPIAEEGEDRPSKKSRMVAVQTADETTAEPALASEGGPVEEVTVSKTMNVATDPTLPSVMEEQEEAAEDVATTIIRKEAYQWPDDVF